MSVGKLIRAARQRAGWTQAELSHRLGVASVQYVAMVELGHTRASATRLREIADQLGVKGTEWDRWLAAAGKVADDVLGALVEHPERWDAVRALLREAGT